jgi:Na+/H+ antiporter NhaC
MKSLYVVYQNLENILMISVSENFLVFFFVFVCLFFFFTEYDLPVPKTSICIYVGHAFYMKHSWTNSFNFLFVCLLKRAMSSSFSCLNSNN